MNANESLTDTELEAMLARLTGRGRADGLEAAIMGAVDANPQQRRPWVRWPDWQLAPAPELRLLWQLAILGLLVALVVGTLAVGSRLLESREPLPRQLPALLEGMVAEEVEPGVFRVVNDGVRDLSPTDAVDVVAGYDGGIWLLREQGFLRLGSDGFHGWPTGSGLESHVLQVAPDGTVWVIPGSRSVFGGRGEGVFWTDGEAWSSQPCPGDTCTGVTVAPDGTLWASWSWDDGWACVHGDAEDCEWWVGYLSPTGWHRLDGSSPADPFFGRLVFTDAGDLYGVAPAWDDYLYRYEDGIWRQVTYVPLLDVGPAGTVWQGGMFSDEIRGSLRGDDLARFADGAWGLARFADGEWAGWTSADLAEIEYLHLGLRAGIDTQFEAAPDGSAWFSMWRSADGGDPSAAAIAYVPLACDGLVRFDGEALDRFLPGQCISAMDIAADGSVWLVAGEDEARDLYVITPEVASR